MISLLFIKWFQLEPCGPSGFSMVKVSCTSNDCGFVLHAFYPEKVCPGYISETIRNRMLKLGSDIGWGCKCATSWCDLDLTFDLAVMTLSLKILSQKQ